MKLIYSSNRDIIRNFMLPELIKTLRNINTFTQFIESLGGTVLTKATGLDSYKDGYYDFGNLSVTIITDDHFVSNINKMDISDVISVLRGGKTLNYRDRSDIGVNSPKPVTSVVVLDERGVVPTNFIISISKLFNEQWLPYTILLAFMIYCTLIYTRESGSVLPKVVNKFSPKTTFNLSLIRSKVDPFRFIALRPRPTSKLDENNVELEVLLSKLKPGFERQLKVTINYNVIINARLYIISTLGMIFNLINFRFDEVFNNMFLYKLEDEEMSEYFRKFDIVDPRKPWTNNKLSGSTDNAIVKRIKGVLRR